jgi:hypothetical protein
LIWYICHPLNIANDADVPPPPLADVVIPSK